MKYLNALNSRGWAACALGSALVLGTAGCGRTATMTIHSAVAPPVATPLPPGASEFSSLASPLLNGALGESKSLLSHMEHDRASTLGMLCSAAGSDISGDESAFHSLYAPPVTHAFRTGAENGFKLVLGAVDECGMAADAGSKSEMKSAVGDMKAGLRGLSSATSLFTKWAAAH